MEGRTFLLVCASFQMTVSHTMSQNHGARTQASTLPQILDAFVAFRSFVRTKARAASSDGGAMSDEDWAMIVAESDRYQILAKRVLITPRREKSVAKEEESETTSFAADPVYSRRHHHTTQHAACA